MSRKREMACGVDVYDKFIVATRAEGHEYPTFLIRWPMVSLIFWSQQLHYHHQNINKERLTTKI